MKTNQVTHTPGLWTAELTHPSTLRVKRDGVTFCHINKRDGGWIFIRFGYSGRRQRKPRATPELAMLEMPNFGADGIWRLDREEAAAAIARAAGGAV